MTPTEDELKRQIVVTHELMIDKITTLSNMHNIVSKHLVCVCLCLCVCGVLFLDVRVDASGSICGCLCRRLYNIYIHQVLKQTHTDSKPSIEPRLSHIYSQHAPHHR